MKLAKHLLPIIKKVCKSYNIKLYVGAGRSVRYGGVRSNGFFVEGSGFGTGKLAVARKAKNWEYTLMHEFSHMLQWIDQCKAWCDYEKAFAGGDVVDPCLKGEQVDPKILSKQLRALLLLERDCEMRCAKILKFYRFSKTQIRRYIQAANAYTIFYLHIEKYHRWYEIGREPYNVRSVWQAFPTTFNVDVNTVYARLGHLYSKCIRKSI